MPKSFAELRGQYPAFHYHGCAIAREADAIVLRFDFSIPGLCEFHPQTRIATGNLALQNAFDSPMAQKIVFALGMVEAVSYWKCACPPRFVVECGSLDAAQIDFWKALWFHGLGEFFYCSGIQTDYDSFVTIEAPQPCEGDAPAAYQSAGLNLIPVGGGKDSCVTMELLRGEKEKNWFFTVNNQPARRDCVRAAGYDETRIVAAQRSIDRALLDCNAQGFLNGHTPFSAIVAFLSHYCAYLIGAEHVILSNESSANEANLSGSEVNHQYSKSIAFETDFRDYVRRYLQPEIQYFSLLRPWNELQIARRFMAAPQYHAVFRSCNAGSRQNIWCGSCAKCLFVYAMLSAFADAQPLLGTNLLKNEALTADFDGLCGFTELKPFECVGTAAEVRAALALAAKRKQGETEPLLQRFLARVDLPQTLREADGLLREWNDAHHIPPRFADITEEMKRFG